MIPLFSNSEFVESEYNNLLPLQCKQCRCVFYRTKRKICRYVNPDKPNTGDFCCSKCQFEGQKTAILICCKNCNVEFLRVPAAINKKSNNFCSQSCAATFNNKNKKFGTRCSKLEQWIKEQLSVLYPSLEIKYNDKHIINSELDIYIPELKIAFEINGIFHYKPIHGLEKFSKIRENDLFKLEVCQKLYIDLYLIDTSKHNYVTPNTSQIYLEKIINVINFYIN